MKTAKPSNRRNFLLTAGLGTAGAAAVVVTGRAKTTPKVQPAASTEPSGYRDTEHIRKYYKTTLV
jgi:hypothetical protein